MNKFLLVSSLIVMTTSLFASDNNLSSYYPVEYREQLETGRFRDNYLKDILFDILSKVHVKRENGADELQQYCPNRADCYRHVELGYREARRYLFGQIHLKSDEYGFYVKDVYCHKDFRNGVGEMKIPNPNKINCEHTWPQSKFSRSFSRSLQKSDLHHLYPTDNKANSARGNFPFADVNGVPATWNCEISRVGTPLQIRRRSEHFEPPTEHKGNVARAIFYFAVRYKMKVTPGQEMYLREWHKNDPVDAEEMRRNNIIHEVQGNRNPFIDMPNLVDSISDF